MNDLKHKSFAANEIYKTAAKVGTNLILVQNNQNIYDEKGLKLINMAGISSDDDNENSIITLLKYKDFSMLFTGDASVKGIKSVLSFLPQNITVLKVPHPGAIGGLDNDVVKYLNPKYSIVSVGDNFFGHPSNYIINLLKNSKVLRTDINNAILLKINTKIKLYEYDLHQRRFVEFSKTLKKKPLAKKEAKN